MKKAANREAWSAWVQEQSASGMSIRAWCAKEGVTVSAFQYWRKCVSTPSAPTTLIALPEIGRPGEPALELRTPQGYVIRIASQAQLGLLGGVLEVLR